MLSRAVDKDGQTVDFLLTPRRDRAAAEAFLHKALRAHGVPEKITSEQSGSNTAAIGHREKGDVVLGIGAVAEIVDL